MAYESYEQQHMTGSRADQPPINQVSERSPSRWAVGFTFFAGAMMIMVGMFQAIEGLAAVLQDDFYVVTADYAFEMDVTTWGWIHLIGGSIVCLAGAFLLTGNVVARIIGITVALFSAISNFFFIPYYPLWTILIIALNIVIIWALLNYRGEDRYDVR
jgi:hypothetical protein